jgi:hypothetical protein
MQFVVRLAEGLGDRCAREMSDDMRDAQSQAAPMKLRVIARCLGAPAQTCRYRSGDHQGYEHCCDGHRDWDCVGRQQDCDQRQQCADSERRSR